MAHNTTCACILVAANKTKSETRKGEDISDKSLIIQSDVYF